MQLYKNRRLTNKEKLDVATMAYFIPNTSGKYHIYPNDIKKMANLSSNGAKPSRETRGFYLLKWGKTYRDEAITGWKSMIEDGLITKGELLDDMPPRFREWLWVKIKDVPYDINGDTSRMFVKMYRNIV